MSLFDRFRRDPDSLVSIPPPTERSSAAVLDVLLTRIPPTHRTFTREEIVDMILDLRQDMTGR